jgi:phosphopentomutase
MDEIQAIRKAVADAGTHGGPSDAVSRKIAALDELMAEVERLRARCKTMEELLTEAERLIRRTPGQHAIGQQIKQFAEQNRWLADRALLSEGTP